MNPAQAPVVTHGTASFPPVVVDLPLSPVAEQKVREVIEAGIRLDHMALVIPDWNRTIEKKICTDLMDIRQRVTQEIQNGKHVLYVPGSYDLLHAGHASWMLEGINAFLETRRGMTRNDLFVVALCDDDELVRGVKPAHVLNTPGEHPRPIECLELFEHLTAKHPRLVDLATLPIDLVGFIPAPSTFGNTINAPVFESWLRENARSGSGATGVALNVTTQQELVKLEALKQNILEGNFGEVKTSFQKAKYNLSYDAPTAAWDVVSWQMLMHSFIGNVFHDRGQERFIRLISENDVKYKDQVAAVMARCGIGHQFVRDVEVVSTTALIKKFGWEGLALQKLEYFQNLYLHNAAIR